jgi:predicted small secreted protein
LEKGGALKKTALYIIIFVMATNILVGCNTARGMKDGAKEDWEVLKKWDAKMREKWW